MLYRFVKLINRDIFALQYVIVHQNTYQYRPSLLHSSVMYA